MTPGCRRTTPPAPVAELALDVVGCSAIRMTPAGPVCELGESRMLRAVLPAGAADARVWSDDDRPLDAGAKPTQETLVIDVPSGATKVVVEAQLEGGRARRTIDLASAERFPWLEEARGARSKGEIDRASELATAHGSDSAPVARALAKGLLARIALGRGRSEDAFPLFREAITLHRAAGRVSDAADDSFALAFALHQRSQRYTEARSVLDAITPDLGIYAEGRARAPYYRGVLAAETGDRRRALALLREAERAARRLGMTRLERNARAALALEMQELGRARQSLPLLAALETELDNAARGASKSDAPSACERVEVANNRGWGALLANEAATSEGELPTEDARGPLERALTIEGCSDAYVRSFAASNLARLALAAGDLATAERRLAEARAGVKEPRGTERIAWLDLEGRLLLARGRKAEALRVLDDALALARASVLRLQEWSLLVARGQALEALGRTKDAQVALQAAEDVLDDATVLVPLGEGRGAFVGGRSRSARALFGLLVRTGQLREAAAMARHAQARVLSSVERALRLAELAPADRAKWEEAVRAFRAARSAIDTDAAGDWKLPADALARAGDARAERERELRAALEGALAVLDRPREMRRTVDAIAPGVLELDIYPDLQGFVAIAIDEQGSSTYRLPAPHAAKVDDLARALFEPLEASLARATTIKTRAYGAWRAVDIHALPWRGEPLLAHAPVEYSLGLGALARPQSGHTLIVGDPTSDLPGALAEAREAAQSLRAQARDTGAPEAARDLRLLVRDEATSIAVAQALRGAGLLHYAGHGIFAGEEGWESALPLAAGGRLTASDVLALAPAPATVVLTGCEAARTAGEAEGVGLAQAFIVAGSTEVLAPVRRVPDALAATLTTSLYGATDHAPLSARARAAILTLRKSSDPGSDWAAFRVLVP